MKIRDSVVVPVSTAIQNGAVTLIDCLELSIIQSAAFAAGFLEVILIFSTCRNAPFGTRYLGMTKQ